MHESSLAQAVSRQSKALGSKKHPEFNVWRPHDLRRTCRTGLSVCGINTEISELVIGHAKAGMVSVYDLHKFEDKKSEALILWEKRLLEILGGNN